MNENSTQAISEKPGDAEMYAAILAAEEASSETAGNESARNGSQFRTEARHAILGDDLD